MSEFVLSDKMHRRNRNGINKLKIDIAGRTRSRPPFTGNEISVMTGAVQPTTLAKYYSNISDSLY